MLSVIVSRPDLPGKPSMTVPCAFFFLTGKRGSLYERCWAILRLLVPNFSPEHCHVDMEVALYGTFVKEFDCIVQFCYFHCIRAWQRRLQSLGLDKLVKKGKVLQKYWWLCKGAGYSGLRTPNMISHIIAILNDEIEILRTSDNLR